MFPIATLVVVSLMSEQQFHDVLKRIVRTLNNCCYRQNLNRLKLPSQNHMYQENARLQ